MRSYFIYPLFLTLSIVTVTQAQRSFIQNWQVVQDSALDVLNKDIRTDNESIITAIDNQLNIPFRLHATTPIPDSSLVIGTNQVDLGDGAGLSSPPAASTLQVFPTSSIDYQTGVTSGGTILRDGFAFTLPVCNVGEFHRHVFVYDSATNSVDSSLSAGVALEASLEDPGVLFDLVKGNPLGYIDLECTNVAGAYKTAGSLTDIIENSVASTPKIFRFGSGAGGGVESINDLDDVDIETTLPNIGEALLWDGSLFAPSAIVNSMDDLNDVDVSTAAPTLGQTLVWEGSQFVPGAATGGGEINYITNWNAESGTITGWVKYEDAVAAIPEDGSGGVTLDQGFIAQNVVVLRGAQSFELNVDANYQGKGVSYDFPIKDQDKNKKLKIQFDFKTDLDSAYLSGDLRVYIYDIDNSLLITPVDTDIIRGVGIFQTSFNSSSSSNYRLIFHIANSTSPWKAYIDNVIIGPGMMISQGAAVGSWVDFFPTFNGLDGTEVVDIAKKRRVGDTMEIKIRLSDVDSTGNVELVVPDGLSAFELNDLAGSLVISNDLTNYFNAFAETLTTIRFNSGGDLLGGVITVSAGTLELDLKIPIFQWAKEGSGIVPMLSEDNLSEWQDYIPINLSGTGTYTSSGKFRRVGDVMEVYGVFNFSVAPTGRIDMSLPAGYTYTHKFNAGGFWNDIQGAENSTYDYFQPAFGGGGYMRFKKLGVINDDLRGDNISLNRNHFFNYSVRVNEWSGSQNSLVGYSLASTMQTGLVSTSTQSFAGDKTFTNNLNTDGNLTVSGTSGATINEQIIVQDGGVSVFRDQFYKDSFTASITPTALSHANFTGAGYLDFVIVNSDNDSIYFKIFVSLDAGVAFRFGYSFSASSGFNVTQATNVFTITTPGLDYTLTFDPGLATSTLATTIGSGETTVHIKKVSIL